MRLSDVLSKPSKNELVQIDSVFIGKKCNIGQIIPLSEGQVALNYFCAECNDVRTFSTHNRLDCLIVSKNAISIDCVLKCCICNVSIPVWFLVEFDVLLSPSPYVRIIRRYDMLSDKVKTETPKYGKYSLLLEKANMARNVGLGAGAIIYLRKAYECITVEAAQTIGLEYAKHESGNPRNFAKLLEQVNEHIKIIPEEFSENGYRLFKELSAVVHGDCDEYISIQKYEPLKRLVLGVLENMNNNEDYRKAMMELGWGSSTGGQTNEQV